MFLLSLCSLACCRCDWLLGCTQQRGVGLYYAYDCSPTQSATLLCNIAPTLSPVSKKGCLGAMQSSAGVGANLPDAEAYASAAGFDFGAGRNSSLEAPRPLLRGGSFNRGFALPMHGPGMLFTLHSLFLHGVYDHPYESAMLEQCVSGTGCCTCFTALISRSIICTKPLALPSPAPTTKSDLII